MTAGSDQAPYSVPYPMQCSTLHLQDCAHREWAEMGSCLGLMATAVTAAAESDQLDSWTGAAVGAVSELWNIFERLIINCAAYMASSVCFVYACAPVTSCSLYTSLSARLHHPLLTNTTFHSSHFSFHYRYALAGCAACLQSLPVSPLQPQHRYCSGPCLWGQRRPWGHLLDAGCRHQEQ